MSIKVEARELPNHIGATVKGLGPIKKAFIVQPGGDIVGVQFDSNSYRETTYRPDELVEIDVPE